VEGEEIAVLSVSALEAESFVIGGEDAVEVGVECGVGALEPLGVGGWSVGVEEVAVEKVGLEMDAQGGVGVLGEASWRGMWWGS